MRALPFGGFSTGDGLRHGDGFDATWYRATYLSAVTPEPDPLTHYCTTGWQSGCRPNRIFDPVWYRARYPDVAATESDPFYHFASIGWHENRDPAALFSTDWYVEKYLKRVRSPVNPLAHYLSIGWRSDCWPHPLFDAPWYANEYAEWMSSELSPLEHYLTIGAKLGFETSPLFDSAWYVKTLSCVSLGELNAIEHYANSQGSPWGSPNRLFDDAWYTARYLNNKPSRLTALGHFVHVGRVLHHKPSAGFDPLDYAASSQNTVRPEDATSHALQGSARWGHTPLGTEEHPTMIIGSLPASTRPLRLAIVACHDTRRVCGVATRHLARSLKQLGFSVVLVYDDPIQDLFEPAAYLDNDFDMLIAADHGGYDFYSWRLALEHIERLIALNACDGDLPIEEIVLLNDSVIGPLFAFDDALAAWRALPFEVSGLVESAAPRPHIQSWATRYAGRAADLPTLLEYYGQAQPYMTKHAAIRDFEIPLAQFFRTRGLTVGSLISPISIQKSDDNPTMYGWREIIESGVPFVKRSVFVSRAEASPTITANMAFLNALPHVSRHEDMEELVREALAQL